jgi:2-polyprenyl-6-methoxyphenol hydroxylase-like FAD-dependent oxidoreductase
MQCEKQHLDPAVCTLFLLLPASYHPRRPPIFRWAKGRVALLGDSAHAMQPNLGQGGCMAIEDAFQLGRDVAAALKKVRGSTQRTVWLGLSKALQERVECGFAGETRR